MENEVNITPPSQPEPLSQIPKPKFRPIVLLVVLGVAVAGYFASAKLLKLAPFQVVAPILTFTPRPSTTNQIEGWKTYRNGKYGYEIKYPIGWTFLEGTEGIESQTTLSKGADLKNIYLESNSDSKRISYIREGEVGPSIQLAGKNWETFLHRENNPGEYGDFRTTLVLTADYNDKKFIIRLAPSVDFSIQDSEFNQILSTFKFIKPSFVIPPAGYNWQLVQGKDKLFKSGQAYYDNRKPGTGFSYGAINFTGKEWLFKSDDKSTGPKFPSIGTPEDDKMMADNGWLVEIPYKGFWIAGIQADGPESSDWAYIKLENNKLSVVLFSYNTNYNGPEIPESPLNCPCDYEYRVFLSDPIDIDSVLPH
jgi:hypothetical protein